MKNVNRILMGLVVVVCLYPFLYTIAVSLSDASAIMAGKVSFWPVDINTEAYTRAFAQPNFGRAFVNSFVYTITGTGLSLILTVMMAYPLSRSTMPGKKLILILVLITMFFPGGMIPNFLVVYKMGMIDTIWSQIVPNAVTPYMLFMMITFMKQLPYELEEAGKIDGMNPIQLLVYLVLPLSKPIIASVTLFTALIYWNNWFSAMIYLNTSKKFPVMLNLKALIDAGDMAAKGQGSVDYEMMVLPASIRSASVLMAAIPIIILYIVLQKQFIKGLMIGAVKG